MENDWKTLRKSKREREKKNCSTELLFLNNSNTYLQGVYKKLNNNKNSTVNKMYIWTELLLFFIIIKF